MTAKSAAYEIRVGQSGKIVLPCILNDIANAKPVASIKSAPVFRACGGKRRDRANCARNTIGSSAKKMMMKLEVMVPMMLNDQHQRCEPAANDFRIGTRLNGWLASAAWCGS